MKRVSAAACIVLLQSSAPAMALPSRFATAAVLPAGQSAGPAAKPTGGRRSDPLWNGLLLGAATGAGVGAVADYYDDCEECHDALYGSILYGAGIGVLIDALWREKRRPSPSFHGLPIVVRAGPRGASVHARITWPSASARK
jgi:hypothetical protein